VEVAVVCKNFFFNLYFDPTLSEKVIVVAEVIGTTTTLVKVLIQAVVTDGVAPEADFKVNYPKKKIAQQSYSFIGRSDGGGSGGDFFRDNDDRGEFN
jgi:hypothetical protein